MQAASRESFGRSALEWERSWTLAGNQGVMERQLERSIQYARDRRQFDQLCLSDITNL